MSLYRRGKSWYYITYRGQRYNDCVGPVTKTRAKEILARMRVEVAEGRYESPAKKPSPRLEKFVEEYFAYYQTNRRPRTVLRHQTSWHAVAPALGSSRLLRFLPLTWSAIDDSASNSAERT